MDSKFRKEPKRVRIVRINNNIVRNNWSIILNLLLVSKMMVTEGPETVSKKKNVTEGTKTVSKKKNNLPPDGNLRVMLSEGCSGSTIVGKLTKDILSRHRFSLGGGGGGLMGGVR